MLMCTQCTALFRGAATLVPSLAVGDRRVCVRARWLLCVCARAAGGSRGQAGLSGRRLQEESLWHCLQRVEVRYAQVWESAYLGPAAALVLRRERYAAAARRRRAHGDGLAFVGGRARAPAALMVSLSLRRGGGGGAADGSARRRGGDTTLVRVGCTCVRWREGGPAAEGRVCDVSDARQVGWGLDSKGLRWVLRLGGGVGSCEGYGVRR